MTQIHDFTRISWGNEFFIDVPIEGINGTITGQGLLAAGDHIVLCVKCRVDEVHNYSAPSDLWQASVTLKIPVSAEELTEGGPLKTVNNLIAQWGDVVQQLDIYQRIEQLFSSDRLTQVANRSKFETRLVEEWQRMRREQTPLSIIFCALEGMDSYQAAYGEEAYEQGLREIAQAIRGCVQRSSDVVARYEEYKFAVLLPNTPLEGANYVAEKIQKQVLTLSCCELTKQPAVTLRFAVETQVPNPEKEAQGLAQSALKSLG